MTTVPRDHRSAIAACAVLLAAGLSGCADEPGPTGPLPGVPPTVLGVEPSVVEAGGRATIRGLDFPTDPSAVSVQFAGQSASVTSAGETSLSIRLPAPSQLPCRPTRRARLTVTAAAGGRDTARHRFSEAPGIELDPGEARSFLSAEDGIGCREYPAADAEYLVSVFNSSRTPSATAGFEVHGSTGAGEPDSTAASASAARSAPPSPGLDPSRFPAPLGQVLRAGRGHRTMLRANRRLVGRARRSPGGLGLAEGGSSRSGARTAADGTHLVSAQQAPPSVGEHVQLRVPDLAQGGNLCENYVQVTGRVVQVTEHAVLVSDTTNPIDGDFDDRIREMGTEFENRMWPVIRNNFGDPLALDAELNDDGHLYMLFTPEVNDFGSALAFVFAGDFFPRSSPDSTRFTCASSDTAEVFYSRAPTTVAPDDYSSTSATAGWQRILRSTLVHEVKHLTANAERLSRDLPLETTWLEESTAHVAEELYARRIFGNTRGGDAGYRETLYCAVRPTVSECRGTPYVLVSEFVWLAQYMDGISRLSAVDASRGDAVFRGSGWWLLRWAIDHAPVSESQFLRDMTVSPETGVSNLVARAGRSWPEILADWTLSLAVDDRTEGGVERQTLTEPSWDLRDVYAGFSRDFGSQIDLFSDPYPLASRRLEYGSFTSSVGGMPGGTAALFDLVGRSEVSQLLELTGTGGGALPDQLRLSVVRLP